MLVVRRRAGEAIIVAGDIEIEIIDISRTRVKLGVTAPREVTVTRREAAAIALENRTAAALVSSGALENDLWGLFSKVSGKMPKRASEPVDM
jgi:carbon storage regulator